MHCHVQVGDRPPLGTLAAQVRVQLVGRRADQTVKGETRQTLDRAQRRQVDAQRRIRADDDEQRRRTIWIRKGWTTSSPCRAATPTVSIIAKYPVTKPPSLCRVI